MSDPWHALEQPSDQVARRLLGCYLMRELDGHTLVGMIVETEAYDQTDAASHSYRGQTPRTDVMFGPPGHLYVYFTYGMHYCCNVVTGSPGHGAAVLIRALEPLEGITQMQRNRHGVRMEDTTNGPAKLCQALQIDRSWNGHDLHEAPLQLRWQPSVAQSQIVQTTRIGIRHAKEVPWRFYLKSSPFVSQRLAEHE